MAQEKPAISVPDECANVYYDNYDKLPESLRDKISLHMLREIFDKMVIPAIDKARNIERGFYE